MFPSKIVIKHHFSSTGVISKKKNQGLSSTSTSFRFDGFIVRSAIGDVQEIFDAMKQTPQCLMNSSEKIVFITGRGYKLRTRARRIQVALLRTFRDTWQDEHNSRPVVMHFRRRLNYADAEEDNFK
ncbi:hypothetical protein CAEBREN_09616 [Caenorhabditis brenneri]|uniref:Uncharacterized protein n=1 Tax=Caenorhabditis brenneri TaxID=135651 RepID=G0NDW0_CAEBE|nr:hypothetical protein CAEBREN_09616 [Caenorhabditis brenneri]